MRFKVYLPLVHPYVIFFFKRKTQIVIDMRKFSEYLAGQPDQFVKQHLLLGRMFWGEILQGYFYIWNCSDLLRICKSTLKTKTRLSRHISNNYKNDNLIVFIYWYVSSLFSLRRLRWRPW